jgi:hypothetical protein
MLINYFLILIVLLLVSGLTLDAGLLEWKQIALQTAADAAAQEAMLCVARNDGTWSSNGQTQAAQNGFTSGVNGVTVTLANPPTSGSYSGDSSAVQATISQSVRTVFMGLVNGGTATVAATAVAKVLPTCLWIMGQNSTNSQTTLHLSSATMGLGCGVYVNTSSGPNLGVDGYSVLLATRIRLQGAASNNDSSGTVTPIPRFGAAAKNDPLAYVASPVFSSCTSTNTTLNNGTFVMNPGTYCGGIEMSGSYVTFNPGLYIVTGGLNWTNSEAHGSGVTFFITQGGGSSYGNVYMDHMYDAMSAPTSSSGGGITGVYLFYDRTWINHNTQNIYIGNSTVSTDGVWYALNTGMTFNYATFTCPNYCGLEVDNIYQNQASVYGYANYTPLSGVSPFHYEDGTLVQ